MISIPVAVDTIIPGDGKIAENITLKCLNFVHTCRIGNEENKILGLVVA